MENVKTQGIVLQNTKYGDYHIISHIFTESHGRLSFFVRGSSKKNNNYRNLLSQLSILNIEFNFFPQKTLQYFKEISFTENPVNFYAVPEKIPVVFLLAELFEKTIKENDTNPEIYHFIFQVITYLHKEKTLKNTWFIQVLVTYLRLLGIAPKIDVTGVFFDMENSRFIGSKLEQSDFLDQDETPYFIQLLNNRNFDELPSIPKAKRLIMIEKIIKYYQIHLGIGEINSFKILKNLYN